MKEITPTSELQLLIGITIIYKLRNSFTLVK